MAYKESSGINIGRGIYSLSDNQHEQQLLNQINSLIGDDQEMHSLVQKVMTSDEYPSKVEELAIILGRLEERQQTPKLKNPNEYFTNARTNTIMEDIRREMREAQGESLIDPTALRQAQDWSELNGKFIGEEE